MLYNFFTFRLYEYKKGLGEYEGPQLVKFIRKWNFTIRQFHGKNTFCLTMLKDNKEESRVMTIIG